MPQSNCHASEPTAREKVRTLVLKTIGVRKIAGWCGTSEAAVYQWLSRGTDSAPLPPEHVPAIMRGAAAEGLLAPVEVLWPEMGDVLATTATEELEPKPEGVQ